MPQRLLLLDNYDSFTYNLLHLVESVSDFEVVVRKNDEITINEAGTFDRIILSPGPGLPSEAGIMPQLLEKYLTKKKILGVCLGLQAIGEALGMTLKNLDEVCHGRALPIHVIKKDALFKSCPDKFLAGRYHSWVIDEHKIPDTVEVTAVCEKGYIMGLRHVEYDVRGVQFHPESVLTEHGATIMKNWLGAKSHQRKSDI